MRFNENISVDWSEKVESSSRILDPLGIQGHHLNIQKDFTTGITSVTRRARYYTIWAYYYEHLYKTQIINPRNYEKIFLLASLAHHDGDNRSPELRHMHNNKKFAGKWDEVETFDLNFDINGLGRTYYNRQMEVFHCAWTDQFGNVYTSRINSKLAGSLSFLNPSDFERSEFTKHELRDLFSGLCICQVSENQKEKDVLSKLMFGFFSEKNGEWDIDEGEFSDYMDGRGELTIMDKPSQQTYFQEYYSVRQQNLRRRNTLLLFLNIIHKTCPSSSDLIQFIWDSIYFRQHRETKDEIDFGKLEHARMYWEIHLLCVYYVFLLERFLEQVHDIVIENVGIPKNQVIMSRNSHILFSYLNNRLGIDVDENTTLEHIIDRISGINGKNTKSSLHSRMHETDVYAKLCSREYDAEHILCECILMLSLLYVRYYQNSQFILRSDHDRFLEIDQLNINSLFNYIQINRGNLKIVPFLSKLGQMVVNRHLLVSAQRLAEGTKNWMFTEENGRLFSAREPVYMRHRDNRWQSVQMLLQDLEFIYHDRKSNLFLTHKGLKCLKAIQ